MWQSGEAKVGGGAAGCRVKQGFWCRLLARALPRSCRSPQLAGCGKLNRGGEAVLLPAATCVHRRLSVLLLPLPRAAPCPHPQADGPTEQEQVPKSVPPPSIPPEALREYRAAERVAYVLRRCEGLCHGLPLPPRRARLAQHHMRCLCAARAPEQRRCSLWRWCCRAQIESRDPVAPLRALQSRGLLRCAAAAWEDSPLLHATEYQNKQPGGWGPSACAAPTTCCPPGPPHTPTPSCFPEPNATVSSGTPAPLQ